MAFSKAPSFYLPPPIPPEAFSSHLPGPRSQTTQESSPMPCTLWIKSVLHCGFLIWTQSSGLLKTLLLYWLRDQWGATEKCIKLIVLKESFYLPWWMQAITRSSSYLLGMLRYNEGCHGRRVPLEKTARDKQAGSSYTCATCQSCEWEQLYRDASGPQGGLA